MAVFIGEVPGHPVGSTYANRKDARPVHPYTVQGIHGNRAEGADSIVLNGGYAEDEDFGVEIIYTGEGPGRDQSLSDAGNAGLVRSQLDGLPVRVLRGPKGDPQYSPATGYRYDGLYRVTRYWRIIGKDGYQKWRFHLEQVDSAGGPWATAAGNGGPTPAAPTGSGVVATKPSVVQRQVRNTAVTEWVKRLYDHTCQVCDARLDLPGGFGYSEGAHIRPVGRPHFGPDTPANVLCLCPSDHVRLDRGAISISDAFVLTNMVDRSALGTLTVHTDHTVDPGHLAYHRQIWLVP